MNEVDEVDDEDEDEDEDDGSFHTAASSGAAETTQQRQPATTPAPAPTPTTTTTIDYGTTDATVCFDFVAAVPMPPRDCLLGQRAISKAQLAREGSNVHVMRHVRQDVDHSYKELFVDITGKLPPFARALLPSFVVWMEQSVAFPSNTASLVCIKPKALRGLCAFSETVYVAEGEHPVFSFAPPTNAAMPHRRIEVDYRSGWNHPAAADEAWNAQSPRAMVCKRFLLDVGSNSLVWRRLRAFIVAKFEVAFVAMLREVELAVREWTSPESRPRFESCCKPGDVAPGPRIWPRVGGKTVPEQAMEVVAQLAQSQSGSGATTTRSRKDSVIAAMFASPVTSSKSRKSRVASVSTNATTTTTTNTNPPHKSGGGGRDRRASSAFVMVE